MPPAESCERLGVVIVRWTLYGVAIAVGAAAGGAAAHVVGRLLAWGWGLG